MKQLKDGLATNKQAHNKIDSVVHWPGSRDSARRHSVQNYGFWTHIVFHSSITVVTILLEHRHTMFGLGMYFLTPFGAER